MKYLGYAAIVLAVTALTLDMGYAEDEDKDKKKDPVKNKQRKLHGKAAADLADGEMMTARGVVVDAGNVIGVKAVAVNVVLRQTR